MTSSEKEGVLSQIQEVSPSPSLSQTNDPEKKTIITESDIEKHPSHVPDPGINRRSSAVALDLLTSIRASNAHHPTHWPTHKRWLIILVYCLLQAFVQLSATTYVSVEYLIHERFGGSTQAITLGQSMFILGNAVGPPFLGPLSDVSGRKWVYVFSILVYALLNIGAALAVNLPMLIVFCFLNGIAGSTALTNVAGTIADLFGDADGAGQPMALFVMSANIGPSIGGPIGEWIGMNRGMSWRWIYWINVIFGGLFALALCFMPETLPRIVIERAVKKERQESESSGVTVVDGDSNGDVVVAKAEMVNVLSEVKFVATMAFKIMFTEPIIVFLGMYNGFAYGLLFLFLDGTYDVFAVNNGLSDIDASLTFLNFGVGVILTFLFMPLQTYLYARDARKHNNHGRPEARFLTSLVTVWLLPISILWFAYTSSGNTSYWSPLIAGVVLGFADSLLWLSMLNYVTDSYSNVAGSAIAAFLIPSFWISAGLCHAGVAMFESLSTTTGFAILGFIAFAVVGLVYVLFFFGRRIRGASKWATKV